LVPFVLEFGAIGAVALATWGKLAKRFGGWKAAARKVWLKAWADGLVCLAVLTAVELLTLLHMINPNRQYFVLISAPLSVAVGVLFGVFAQTVALKPQKILLGCAGVAVVFSTVVLCALGPLSGNSKFKSADLAQLRAATTVANAECVYATPYVIIAVNRFDAFDPQACGLPLDMGLFSRLTDIKLTGVVPDPIAIDAKLGSTFYSSFGAKTSLMVRSSVELGPSTINQAQKQFEETYRTKTTKIGHWTLIAKLSD
jgi:hypothetical protein